MIIFSTNIENNIPDIQPLIKAFYPGEEVLSDREISEDVSGEAMRIRVEFPEDVFFPVRISVNGNWSEELPVKGETNASGLDSSDRVAIRNCGKRLLYKVLARESGRELPWGVLTGIRPTRIAQTRLKKGIQMAEAQRFMRESYYVSEKKARLATEIAQRELDIIAPIDYEEGYSLYIGIPFCPTTCLYCSFASNPISAFAGTGTIDGYLDAVEKELDFTVACMEGRNPDSVYIGGGTPTAISASEMDRLLTMLDERFDMSAVAEFTVESGRPDSISRDKLEVMKAHGVGRISINPQTFSDKTLKLIGRHHTVQQTIEAYELARVVGFDNINMDLILGLPGESVSDVEHTLSEVKRLKPDSLTVHSLAIKRASRLSEWMKENDTEFINTDSMMDMCAETASELGLLPYYLYRQKNMAGNFENVGYAAEGKAGLYNILMMEEVQTIVACGAGTVTKRVFGDGHIERCDDVKDVGLYIEKIDEMIERKRILFSDEREIDS